VILSGITLAIDVSNSDSPVYALLAIQHLYLTFTFLLFWSVISRCHLLCCRVQPGECYHLYTAFHEAQFADYQLPEMLRTRLEELCLQIKVTTVNTACIFAS